MNSACYIPHAVDAHGTWRQSFVPLCQNQGFDIFAVTFFFFLNMQNCQVRSSATERAHLRLEDILILWDDILQITMALRALVSAFHIQTLLCPVNFNTVYWEVQSNPDVCWQKFYRWWQDPINSMLMMLVNVSFWEISFYAPGSVSSSTALRSLSTEAKDKKNVSMS